MKVVLLGPVAWRSPPRAYGPWEQVTGLLAEGLVAARCRRDPLRNLVFDHSGPAGRRMPAQVRGRSVNRRPESRGDARLARLGVAA